MKALKPTMREKKRYLYLTGKDLKRNVPKAISDFIGQLGASEASVHFIEANENSAIISINREALEKVKASLALSKERIEVTKVSGTIKGLN